MRGARLHPALAIGLPVVSVLALLGLWQAMVQLRGIPPIYLPAPTAIAQAMGGMIEDGSLPVALGWTVLRILVGFSLAAVAGIAIGVLMGMSRIAAAIADPWIAALYPLPKISLIPLLIIWMGTGESYKVAISAISAFFPIVMSTYAAVLRVDDGLIKAAQDLGASRRQVQMKVVIPASIPQIASGLELGLGVTIILVVAAEMIGGSSQSGMGFLLINAGQVMETEQVFACLVVMAIAGAVIVKLQQALNRLAAPWAHNRK